MTGMKPKGDRNGILCLLLREYKYMIWVQSMSHKCDLKLAV